ncbi:hypothetical protein LIS04_190 [Listeria phage LIS04]|nr:hypothetical protein LIS04_190 [Listeria phage LIS04]
MNKFQEFSQKVLDLEKEYGVFIDTIQNGLGVSDLIVVDEETQEFRPLWNGESD